MIPTVPLPTQLKRKGLILTGGYSYLNKGASPRTEKELNAQKSLQTFYTYIRSWGHLLPAQDELTKNQEKLDSFKRLQGGVTPKGVQGPFLRGALTLKLMKHTGLLLDTHPDLAASANYWAPVQAYYAAHGFGLAALMALGAGAQRDHRHFRGALSNQVMGKLLPYPFCMLCVGDPANEGSCNVENCPAEMKDVAAISNLSTPAATNAHLLAGKSLLTTRKYFVKELLEKHREDGAKKGKSRKNLKPDHKRKLSEGVHGTSIIDLFYRMRVRSNYDDPEMFIFGQADGDVSAEHYRSLLALVDSFATLSGNIIRRKIGREAYNGLLALASR